LKWKSVRRKTSNLPGTETKFSAASLAVFIGSLCLSISCGSQSSSTTASAITSCVLASDQTGTIQGHWPVTPIPVAVQQGQFTSTELTKLRNAVDTWNSFYSETKGFPLLDAGQASGLQEVNQTKPTFNSLCQSSIASTEGFSGKVVLYKVTSWPYSNDIIGLTTQCPISGTPYRKFYMAMLELNFRDYWVTGGRQPDLESIVLHELGHLLGLDHSCSSQSKDGVPGCSDEDLNPDYAAAIMYPSISFKGNYGEERRTLETNDQERANCLYE
jgi:hypothetical protein